MTPDYIVNNWTDEFLDLMVEKLTERKERERQTRSSASSGDSGGHTVPASILFAQASNLVKVIKT